MIFEPFLYMGAGPCGSATPEALVGDHRRPVPLRLPDAIPEGIQRRAGAVVNTGGGVHQRQLRAHADGDGGGPCDDADGRVPDLERNRGE